MHIRLIFAGLIIGMLILVGCRSDSKPPEDVATQRCSDNWYSLVEQYIPTGDGQGHGPDRGSLEWRSVVEFKLGIRGNIDLPPRESEQWCDYIHTHYIDSSIDHTGS